MQDRIKSYRRRSVVTFFGVFYLLTLFVAIYPPLYQWRSTVDFEVFGVPFATLYWLADALLLAVGLGAFYKVAELRGELDQDLLKPAPSGVRS
ncbi:MAG: hypothetical protein ABWY93_06385 [Mycobacterium sp.]